MYLLEESSFYFALYLIYFDLKKKNPTKHKTKTTQTNRLWYFIKFQDKFN